MLDLIKILNPETELERRIVRDPDFIAGAISGKERRGHPEGQVAFHIREVFKNIEKYAENDEEREKLRLIALIHDSFKHQVNRDLPRVGDNHHSRLARKFAERYIKDEDILQVIMYHDDAYNTWVRGTKSGNWDKAEYQIQTLIDKIDDIDLYTVFYQCDNETGSKTSEDFDWFIKHI